MMDADERLTALKKAYADIILNTAKEAAARIMVSERKALRFQHELNNAKQNALQMLIRLKRMMDSKISEAEMASLTQQKKIDELEAQLQEAEDIVKDLREELRAVQAEIERVPPSKEVMHPAQLVVASEENIHSTPPPAVFTTPHVVFLPSEVHPNIVPHSDMGNSDVDQRNKGQSFYNSLLPLKKSYIGKPDLPSIILRSKETELYRNGCTQRIRACGQTPIGKEFSFSEQTNDIKPESIAKEDEGGEKLHKVPLLGAETVCDMEKKNVLQEDSRISSWCQVHDGKRRRRARPCWKKTTSCPSQPLDQVNKMERAADNSAATCPPSTNDMTEEKESEKATNTDTDIVRTCYVQRTLGEEQVPVRPQISEAQADPSLVNMESKSSDSSGVPTQQIKERVIKYTFQRKRKRGTSIADGKVCAESCDDDLKIKEEENGSAHLESEKSSSIEESTQEKSRLEQVAHQLISLSEWQ